MSGTYAQEHRLRDAQRRQKLVGMLRNTLRSFPMAKLVHGRGVFGASLGDENSLQIVYRGRLTAEDIRDLLALFATWLAVDPQRLVSDEEDEQGGVSWMDGEARYLSSGRLG